VGSGEVGSFAEKLRKANGFEAGRFYRIEIHKLLKSSDVKKTDQPE
jgi:hypothetical protein